MGEPVPRIPIAMIYFGEVVIFGGKPEYGYGLNASPRNLFGAADGRERLVDAVSRARKIAPPAGLLRWRLLPRPAGQDYAQFRD